MGAARLVSTNTGLGHASARLPAGKAMRAGRGDRSAKRLRVTIVLALFIVLIASALLVGRAVIAPVLTTVTGGRGGARVGEIVYSMPDGSFCRRLSFDNDTAALIEGAVEQCPANLPRMRVRGDRNFAWGARCGAFRAFLVILWIGARRHRLRTIDGRPTRRDCAPARERPARKGNRPYGYHAFRASAGVARRRTSDRPPRRRGPGSYGRSTPSLHARRDAALLRVRPGREQGQSVHDAKRSQLSQPCRVAMARMGVAAIMATGHAQAQALQSWALPLLLIRTDPSTPPHREALARKRFLRAKRHGFGIS